MLIAIHLNAGNDRNGNPRRVYVVLNENGAIVDTIDEGYSGDSGVRKLRVDGEKVKMDFVFNRFETTPKEYRELVKFGNDLRKKAERKSVVDSMMEEAGKKGRMK